MFKRQFSYVLLIGFATVMVSLLMLDDTPARRVAVADYQATQQALRPIALFPELVDPAQIYGVEVLDVTTRTGILLMRNEQGLWYAPALSESEDELPAERINQPLIENAVDYIRLLGSQQLYEATSENLVLYGLQPEPDYRLRFVAQDTAGVSYAPVILEVGDTNPDHVAYYVWPDGDQHIYLIPKPIVDPLLQMVTEAILPDSGVNNEETAPAP